MAKAALEPIGISNRDARHLILDLQGLTAKRTAKQSDADLLALIQQMGYVQLDSIATVERAHHMILFSRNVNYKQEALRRLIEEDRHLFENWVHDAAIIPTDFFPYWQRSFISMRKARQRPGWKARLGKQPNKAINHVRDRLEAEGPLMSRDFKDKKKTNAAWWGWGPSKTALEYLWRTGEAAVTARQGFQKVYDLTHRVIPEEHHSADAPDNAATIDWFCHQAIDRLGVATPREIAAFWEHVSTDDAKKWVTRELGNSLVPVEISCAQGGVKEAVARPDITSRLEESRPLGNGLRLISPFDPIIRDRDRCQRIFDFNYRIEIFVPAAKRQYGYYVFPILEGARFTGRIDLKAERKEGVLKVLGLWWEPGVKVTPKRMDALAKELTRLARFSGCERADLDALQRLGKAG